jgi:PPOX class probable FMN-dependent enzyme
MLTTRVEEVWSADRLEPIGMERIRELLGHPSPKVVNKVRADIGELERRFIAHSPFLTIATHDASGGTDCSPRGDQPGFVKVLDERTLAIPDRLGNKLADSFSNICERPGVGLLFLVPGVRESLRINGDARVVDDPAILKSMMADGKCPPVATVVKTIAVYLHCGKALIRSGLWNAESQSYGAALTLGDHVEALQTVAQGGDHVNTATIAADCAQVYATQLY